MIVRPPARPPSRLKLEVTAKEAGLALAEFLVVRGGITLEEAKAAIERGGAFVLGKRVKNASTVVKLKDRVEVMLRERGVLISPPPAETQAGPTAAPIALSLLFLDSQLVAVDKPAGVLAQEGRAGGQSLVDVVKAQLVSEGGGALLVHRLDRGTTGVTLLARNRDAQAFLLEEFREGRVEKEYVALVAGRVAEDKFEVALALGADETQPNKRKVDPRGESAHTAFEVIERLGEATLVRCRPTTGRTHQIRVHLAAHGHPLLGDVRYGGPAQVTHRADGRRLEFTRPLLHARGVIVRHPHGTLLSILAPEPKDLLEALAFLREEPQA